MSTGLNPFIDDVAARAGDVGRVAIIQGTRTTLQALGALLGGAPPALHDVLPQELRTVLQAGEGRTGYSPEALYDRVAVRTGLPLGPALEIAQSVMAELGARLPEAARTQLRESLPRAWAKLVLDPRPEARTPAPAAATADRHTLATGRPGSERALADSAPTTAHANSVSMSDEPHADRRLSATRPGPPAQHTLADGRPGSEHPIADTD